MSSAAYILFDPDTIPIGMLGTIDVVHENGADFWVETDAGGFNIRLPPKEHDADR